MQQLQALRQQHNPLVIDLYKRQWLEWHKLAQPGAQLSLEELELAFAQAHLGPLHDYGTWVYYPWANRLLHILNEAEFIAVRTNRNCYKITPEELATLSTKKVGIIGLSVGSAVALTLAQERACGELRLADFDEIDLSNLNRLRTGLHNQGVNKAVVTAREIAEFDPYLKVTCFTEGFTEDNATSFICENGQLDLLVDECDSLFAKYLCRYIAKDLGLPVLMETSDRGMLDIERFDLEPERPLFHGKAPADLNLVKTATPEQRMQLVWQIIDGAHISSRLKQSFAEIGKTISTWPQLGSAVALGGAVVTDVSRRILLGNNIASGRYYIDLEKLVPARTTLVESIAN